MKRIPIDGWLIGAIVVGLALVGGEIAFGPRGTLVLLCGVIAASFVALGYLAAFTWQGIRFFLGNRAARQRRLAILETKYGRTAGWFVEYGGRRLALLTDPQFGDMFWDTYHIEPLTTDPNESRRITTDQVWWLKCEFTFRNTAFDEIAPFAFPGGDCFDAQGRVWMRGLYLNIEAPTSFETFLLWCRRLWRGHCFPKSTSQDLP
jgi:hypothetical protein